MPLPVAEVQRALADERLDGWLLYDFQGSNPIAARLSGLAAGKKMTTRRWYYLIPATGEPRGLVHAIERHNLDGLPGEKQPYAGRDRLEDGLRGLLQGMKTSGDGILARQQHPLHLQGRRRHDRVGARPRRRGGVVGRPGAAVRGAVVRRSAGLAPDRVRRPVSGQGSGVRARPGAPGGGRRADRVRRAAGDDGAGWTRKG